MGLNSMLVGAGQVQGQFDKNVNDAYRRGQIDTQNAQLNAMRQQQVEQEALKSEMRRNAATQIPGGIMGAPAITPGHIGTFTEPPAPELSPQGRVPGTFTDEEVASAVGSDAGGLAPPTRTKPGSNSKVTPPIGFSAPVPPPRPTTAPQTRSGGQIPPYGASGRGMVRNYGPVVPTPGASQGDIRKFDQQTNPEVKPYTGNSGQQQFQFVPNPNAAETQSREQILMQEIADNPSQEGAIGKELGYTQDAQRKAGNPNVGLPVPAPSNGGVEETTIPGIRTGGGTGTGDSMGGGGSAAPTPQQAPMGGAMQPGSQFFGGDQNGAQHYNFYDQLAAQQAKMAQIHMLSGDPDRAQAAVNQANMARLEQYNILGGQALNAARRGDPTQLLSLMNFYDPGAGYSVQAMRDGSVQILSNGQPIGQQSMGQFLDSAQMMVSKAYYDQMTALKAKIYEEYMKQGFQAQREMAVEDVKGPWKVREAQELANARGLIPTVDSATGRTYFHDSHGNVFIYQEGVPIAGTKYPTAGTLVPVGRQ